MQMCSLEQKKFHGTPINTHQEDFQGLKQVHNLALPEGIKVRIHGAILRAILHAMAELHRVSTQKFVARNIAAVESRPTSATLRATNFFVYSPSAAFRAIV